MDKPESASQRTRRFLSVETTDGPVLRPRKIIVWSSTLRTDIIRNIPTHAINADNFPKCKRPVGRPMKISVPYRYNLRSAATDNVGAPNDNKHQKKKKVDRPRNKELGSKKSLHHMKSSSRIETTTGRKLKRPAGASSSRSSNEPNLKSKKFRPIATSSAEKAEDVVASDGRKMPISQIWYKYAEIKQVAKKQFGFRKKRRRTNRKKTNGNEEDTNQLKNIFDNGENISQGVAICETIQGGAEPIENTSHGISEAVDHSSNNGIIFEAVGNPSHDGIIARALRRFQTKELMIDYQCLALLNRHRENGRSTFLKAPADSKIEFLKCLQILDELELIVGTKNHAIESKILSNLARITADPNNAIAFATKAINVNPNFKKGFAVRGSLYHKMEYYREALEDYQVYLETEPNDAEIFKQMQECKAKLLVFWLESQKTYYDVLRIPTSAGSGEIRKAYKKLALEHHPDKHVNDIPELQEAHERIFKVISTSLTILLDPVKRIRYNLENLVTALALQRAEFIRHFFNI